ncbi:MAG: hypothetical protein MJ252_19870, partial [archaeon]|nr:hypothetical protein [archaeon]
IFSAPNYCGEFDNGGALMKIEEDMTCSFKVLQPITVCKEVPKKAKDRPKTPPRKRNKSKGK